MSGKPLSSRADVTLVYGFDPICGWCFGFRSAVASLRASLAGRVGWRVACGGLVTGERIKPIGETRDYLVHGMAMVESRTDARFGDGFKKGLLARGSWVSTSEPGCRAVLLVQELFGSERALDFGAELSRAFYVDGRATDDVDSLKAVAQSTKVDPVRLIEAWSAPGAEHRTWEAFTKARSEGVVSYPSMFLDRGRGLEPLFSGCLPAKEALALVERALA
ncbi:MAG: hypothetical protein SFW67_35370 [Myxococcaceae bacterium]|nr:hypothetical protein [Myxococcaceae bacterium]